MKPALPAVSHRSRAATAFTLIEIVIVLTIISILGAGVMYMTKSWIDSSKETRVVSDIDRVATALLGYESRASRLPTTDQGLKALVDKPTTEPVPERWTQFLKEVPMDPWGQEYKYRNPGQKSKDGYDVWTVGPDGQDGTEDDIGNWKSTAAK
ncbi:MAG TPA: type II secretion system major pseudopilin GspG [Prosthecobacter sp.]|nr:type II secretion system major pseudopilin GspG [Prosthecobacter sp.]